MPRMPPQPSLQQELTQMETIHQLARARAARANASVVERAQELEKQIQVLAGGQQALRQAQAANSEDQTLVTTLTAAVQSQEPKYQAAEAELDKANADAAKADTALKAATERMVALKKVIAEPDFKTKVPTKAIKMNKTLSIKPDTSTTTREWETLFETMEMTLIDAAWPQIDPVTRKPNWSRAIKHCYTRVLTKGERDFYAKMDKDEVSWPEAKSRVLAAYAVEDAEDEENKELAQCLQNGRTVQAYGDEFIRLAEKSFTTPVANWTKTLTSFCTNFETGLDVELLRAVTSEPAAVYNEAKKDLKKLLALAKKVEKQRKNNITIVKEAQRRQGVNADKDDNNSRAAGGRKRKRGERQAKDERGKKQRNGDAADEKKTPPKAAILSNKTPQDIADIGISNCTRCGREHLGGKHFCFANKKTDGSVIKTDPTAVPPWTVNNDNAKNNTRYPQQQAAGNKSASSTNNKNSNDAGNWKPRVRKMAKKLRAMKVKSGKQDKENKADDKCEWCDADDHESSQCEFVASSAAEDDE
mgnify:FL=1